jgi:hypothetical protein
MPEFKEVCFEQFKTCLKDHQKQATKQWFLNAEEEKVFEYDMKLYLNSHTQTKQGTLIFDISLAMLLLHEMSRTKSMKVSHHHSFKGLGQNSLTA